MSSLKFFHTADLHLGAEMSYLGTRANERRFEILSVFKNMVAFCLQNEVNVCLIAGDLFDSNAAAETFAPSVLEYIESAKEIKFFYVAGNHDPLDAASPFVSKNLPENLFVFGGEYEVKEFEELSLRIVGRSFVHSSMESKPFKTALPSDELFNVMLLHADIASDKASPYNPIDRDFIENSGVRYLALGHIHKRTAPATFGGTTFAYPGSPEGHGFDEEGVRGGYLVSLEDDRCELSFVKLSRRVHRIEKIDMSKATSSINAAALIEERLKSAYGTAYTEDLYKIVLTGFLDQNTVIKSAEIQSILKDKLYFVKIKDQTRKAYDVQTLKNEISLRGIFVKKMLLKIASADDDKKQMIEDSLYVGLAAFDSEVAVNED